MADDPATITVLFPSPILVSDTIDIELTHDGTDQSAADYTVTFSDSGAGGTFDPASASIGSPGSGTPGTISTRYTPAAAGTVTFNFSDDWGGGTNVYDYVPNTLSVANDGSDLTAELAAPSLSVANGGSGPLMLVRIKPYVRENQHARSFFSRIFTQAGAARVWSMVKLARDHLLALNAEEQVKVLAGVKDEYGVWSPATTVDEVDATNFTAGAVEASIGSGTKDQRLLEAPSVQFPDVNVGSGFIQVHKTLVGAGFYDETRTMVAARGRWAFRVKLVNLDSYQQQIIQRWAAQLNTAFTPFTFEIHNPMTRVKEPYTVRFRDSSVADRLREGNLYDFEFTLIELASYPLGGKL